MKVVDWEETLKAKLCCEGGKWTGRG